MSGGRAPPPRPWWLSWPGLLVAAVMALAWRGSGGDLGVLASREACRAAADLARGFWPPAHDPRLLAGLARPLAETVAIALLGMALALALGGPLALLATSPDVAAACGARRGAGRRAAQLASRGVLAFMRAVPEVVWALLFVRALGLGPAPGVLAIGVAYAGVVGKVFADLLETVPRGAAEALGAAGARPAAAFLFGMLPAARPLLTSYALYRLDCALRASAVLGLVGAGGIGQQVELSLRMLRYDEVATYVLALFVLVAVVDLASRLLRSRAAARRSLAPASRRSLLLGVARGVAWLATLLAAARLLELAPWQLLSRGALRAMATFAVGLWPPDLSAATLRALAPALAETLAISVLGTALAAVAGLALAWLAARPLGPAAAQGRAARRALAVAVALAARAALNLGRTLPELLWALLFVLAVGLGPFAGALALGVHTAGVLGRLDFEVLEEVPAAPLQALRALGAGGAATALHGVWPQVFPTLVAYALYRWEVNVRAAAVLGVVGAGGLGRDLKLALSWFDYPRAATLLLAVLVLVAVVEAVSGAIRRRVLRGRAVASGPEQVGTERALAA